MRRGRLGDALGRGAGRGFPEAGSRFRENGLVRLGLLGVLSLPYVFGLLRSNSYGVASSQAHFRRLGDKKITRASTELLPGRGFPRASMERFVLFSIGFLLLLSALPCALQAAAVVDLGVDVLARHQFGELQGKRVGLITNASGVNKNGVSTLDLLLHAPGVRLTAIFAPEHGLYGTAWAGEKVDSLREPRSGLPIYSLYGETWKPTPEMLREVDILVYDVQDIGCRSYTYISTLGLAMEAAAENDKDFCVLDRPNPLGGLRSEGMPLDSRFRSFVGEWDVPYVYGLTAGELARMIAGEEWISKRPRLTVVAMNGWRRDMLWEDTGLLWVPPSPNIPEPQSAFHYVLTGLLGELSGVNNGVGTPLPFALAGSPALDPYAFARALAQCRIQGLVFLPCRYRLFGRETRNTVYAGVQIHLRDPRRVPLIPAALTLLEEINKALNGSPIAGMRAEESAMFDKLCGGDAVRLALQQGRSIRELWESWDSYLEEYRIRRQKYLLYPEPAAEVPAAAPVVRPRRRPPASRWCRRRSRCPDIEKSREPTLPGRVQQAELGRARRPSQGNPAAGARRVRGASERIAGRSLGKAWNARAGGPEAPPLPVPGLPDLLCSHRRRGAGLPDPAQEHARRLSLPQQSPLGGRRRAAKERGLLAVDRRPGELTSAPAYPPIRSRATRAATRALLVCSSLISSALSGSSTIFSTPLRPRTTGTPTNCPVMPYWPLHQAEQGRSRF
ncbi:conserved protein of unknown function [Methylacidimicrobium sp. AP8]|nr:conserved protein of unknown function [Methylacidimicrobium sp. AP8]